MVLALALALVLPLSQPAFAVGDMGKSGHTTTVSLGASHSAAITANGDLYMWGANTWGQLGLGDSGSGTNRLTPTKVPGISNVVSVSLGFTHSAAITANGDLYTWGSNAYGQLGLGDSGNGTARTSPAKVTGISKVNAISMGGGGGPNNTISAFSAAITTDGSLYMWGDHICGQLGIGPPFELLDTNITTPQKVTCLGNGVQTVSLGYFHSAAIVTFDGLRKWEAWGSNEVGELGIGGSGASFMGDIDGLDPNTPVEYWFDYQFYPVHIISRAVTMSSSVTLLLR